MAKNILRVNNRISQRGRIFQYNPPKPDTYWVAAVVAVSLFPKLMVGPMTTNGNVWLYEEYRRGWYHPVVNLTTDIVEFEITGLTSKFEQFLDRVYAWWVARS